MKFTLTIDCDNEAFSDDNLYTELARILTRTARSVADGQTDGKLRDINGNTVGFSELQDESTQQ